MSRFLWVLFNLGVSFGFLASIWYYIRHPSGYAAFFIALFLVAKVPLFIWAWRLTAPKA
jgi:hypothetical protein